MQIQTESCSRKILKNFNFEIKNAINGYFRCILNLNLQKQGSCHVPNQHSQIYQNIKFHVKTKKL